MIPYGLPVLLLAVLLLAAVRPEPSFALRILSPSQLYLVGRCRIEAGAFDATGKPYQEIAYMTLWLDGREMESDGKPPFSWEIDVGPELQRHRIQLAGVARDGARSTLAILSSTHPFVEAVGVDLVLVPAIVRDAIMGRVVKDLSAGDFTILEDGVAQPITSFSAEPLPAAIALALDNSPSMERHLWSAQKAIVEFIRSQPSYSAISFLTFNDQVFLEQEFTHDAGAVAQAVAAARTGGMRTALYDSVRVGSMHLAKRSGVRVLVLFTDGEDTVYEADEGRLRTSIDAAQSAGVTVFAVAYAGAGTEALQKIASQTGGEVVAARGAEDLKQAFARITESLGSRYVLGYEPEEPKKPGYRSIEVRVSRPGAVVLARRGYLIP